MQDELKSGLERLLAVQADLRRRMDALEERVALFRRRLENEDETGPALAPKIFPAIEKPPRPFASVGVEPVLPPPLPVEELASPPPPPPKSPDPPPFPAENLELKVGKYWLVRMGVLVLLTGLVLLGNLAYRTFIVPMGPGGKLALLYLAGGLLTFAGWWLERHVAQVKNYARVLLAGGAAALYYTTYAAHFAAPLRVIESPLAGGVLLLVLAGVLVWFAERRKSQGVAFAAVLLSYYTSAINPAANFTLFSNALLAAAAAFFLVRRRWLGVSWLGLVGSYAGFAYWRWLGRGDLPAGDGGGLWVTHGFLAAYWIIFTVAVFCRRAGTFRADHRTAFLTANNAAFFGLLAPAVAMRYPEQFWIFGVGFGVVLLGLSLLARRAKPEEPIFDGAYLAQGLMVLATGLAAKFSGYQLGLILALQSVALIFCGRARHRVLCEVAAALSALAAFVLAFDSGAPHPWLVAALTGVFLLTGARLWKGLRGPRAASWDWFPAGFSLLALILGGWALKEGFSEGHWLWAFLAAAILFTFLGVLAGLPEVSVLALGYLAVAWLRLVVFAGDITWTQGAPYLAAALLLVHWWRGEKCLGESPRLVLEAGASFAFCAGLFVWIAPELEDQTAMQALAVAGLLLLAYGILLRAWFLAGLSQVFTLGAAGVCLWALLRDDMTWQPGLVAIGGMAAQSALTRWIPETGRRALVSTRWFYHGVILVLAGLWIFRILPPATHVLVFIFAGGLISIPAALWKHREHLVHSAALMALGLAVFWFRVLTGEPMGGFDFLALLLALGLQQVGKNLLAGTPWFPPWARNLLAVAAMGGLWLRISRWSWDAHFPISIAWALLAFALLGAGFLLRERAYRLMGLLVLAVAVGNVFFVEVWKMGQFAGILGILGLAIVLLALGFIYNRFAGQIRKWL